MEKMPGHTYEFKVLLRVYISLLVLAGAMIGISRLPLEALPLEWIDLHVLKGLLILGVALVMTTLVAGFLMGLKYEKGRLNTLVFLGNFAFLALFVVFTWADVNFRGLIDPAFEKQINWESPVLKANEANEAGASHDDDYEDDYEDEDYEDYEDEADAE
jgi:caa(3)-type oxidase subunit IV